MNYVRLPTEMLTKRQRRTREESEPLMIVAVAVDGRAGKVFGRFDQVSRGAGCITLPDSRGPDSAPPLHRNVLNNLVG